MGRLTRPLIGALTVTLLLLGALAPPRAVAFTGFGAESADATYGQRMVFNVQLAGGVPDRLELLLGFEGSDSTFVAPVAVSGSSASYTWDAASSYVTPNTTITYRWRATTGSSVVVTPPATLLYDDDRPGLDWQSAQIGGATVHWYGGSEAQARRFGDLSSGGAQRAEELLGHQLDGPIDIFVYATHDDFFGALGPGAREWTGAAAYPELRTIFMWLGGGPESYLETTIVHEVTHVVFYDATHNPYHDPAHWLNEGLATWSEQQSDASQRSTVAFEAANGGLFAFPAIAAQFPIGSRGSSLSYAMGTTMIQMIIDEHGRDSMARLAAAYRDGASDDEALRAATGMSAQALYDEFYAAFGVNAPSPVEPAPLLPSTVDKPGQAQVAPTGPAAASAVPAPSSSGGGATGTSWVDVAALVLVGLLILGGMLAAWRVMQRVGHADPR
jgi:Peptidase MA superfamily